MSFRNLLDNKGNIQRYTEGAADGQGGNAAGTWATIFWNVPICFETLNRGESTRLVVVYQGKNIYPEHYIYMEYRSVKEGDKLIDRYGKKYIIVLVEDWSEKKKKLRLSVVEEDRNK